MKKITMTKGMSKELYKELKEVLRTTDYSNFQVFVGYDSEENIVVIPKPLMALTLVDQTMAMKLMKAVSRHPNCKVIIA